MILEDCIMIQASPDQVFRFFEEMEQNYVRLHPDHTLFRWVRGRGVQAGNRFYFEEHIAGQLLKKEVVFTRVEPGRHLEFAPTFWLMRLFLPRMFFHLQPEGAGTRVIARIELRMGPLAAKLNARELAAVRQHMREEGENLKRLVEQEPSGVAMPVTAPARRDGT